MNDEPKDPRESGDEESSGESLPPPDTSRWKRPEDRFPALPNEAPPPSAPLKEPPRRRPIAASDADLRGRDRSRNLITAFFLLATCGLISYFAVIWQNPYSALNPLAPPTPLPLVITATFTATIPPTPTLTLVPSETLTPSDVPSAAPTATFTPIAIEGFSTPQGTPAATEDTSSYRFGLQGGIPTYLTNPDTRGGCKWSSIAGSVRNLDGSALNGYGVHIVGDGIDETVGTGSVPSVGPGGFEVPLGNAARDAQFIAQLVDPQGEPASPVYTVLTYADCERNITKLLFVENAQTS